MLKWYVSMYDADEPRRDSHMKRSAILDVLLRGIIYEDSSVTRYLLQNATTFCCQSIY